MTMTTLTPTPETMMTERDQITELEHRIGQATMMAESIALEGGVRRECALRFLAALEVPVAEWPVAEAPAPADTPEDYWRRKAQPVIVREGRAAATIAAEPPGEASPSADTSRTSAIADAAPGERTGAPEIDPVLRLCRTCLHDGVLELAWQRAEAAEGEVARLLEEITAVRALALTNGIPLADLERVHDAAHAGEDGSEEENGEH